MPCFKGFSLWSIKKSCFGEDLFFDLLAIRGDCSSVASKQGTPNQTKPSTTMNQYKAVTRVPHISEPFVDWYEAETKEQALAMWEHDRKTFGLPDNASVTFTIGKGEA
jgi:hypothetical protein